MVATPIERDQAEAFGSLGGAAALPFAQLAPARVDHLRPAERRAALQTTGQLMDDDAFRQAVAVLSGAPQVLCVGSGWSGVLARLAAGTFTKYGIRATGEDLGIEQLALVEVVDPATVLFAVSHRG